MTNLTKQIISVITAGALVVNTAGVAFADTTIQISGNGATSNNAATVNQTTTNVVTQTNDAHVSNDVDSNANSGGNSTNYNTGGNASINTGSANTTTTVQTAVNSNSAEEGCNCQAGNTDTQITGNGAGSQNTAIQTNTNTTVLTQTNHAGVWNDVDSNAKSGNNQASDNTGGNVSITTGPASAGTLVNTMANENSAVVGSASNGTNPTATFKVAGNGAGSANLITGTLSQSAVVNQDNHAWIGNHVDSNANSGHNNANYNGGSVSIVSGPATAGTEVDNMANFNSADLGCGCGFGVLAKIAGNGAGAASNNTITLGLTNTSLVGQTNYAGLHNWLHDQDANSGFNSATYNTGATFDPSVTTGPATAGTTVTNHANVNTLGNLLSASMPDFNVGVNFDVSAFLAWLHVNFS